MLLGWEEQVHQSLEHFPSLPEDHATAQLVRTIKDNISIRLKKVLLKQGQLFENLNYFRDVFLLGKGDLLLLFQDALSNLECDAIQYRRMTCSGNLFIF